MTARRMPRQDGRGQDIDLGEFSIEQMRLDLGQHRLEELPLSGDKRGRQGFQDFHNPHTSSKTKDVKSVTKWAGLYDPNEDQKRMDGLGAGNLHRQGENFRPVKRSSSTGTRFPRRPITFVPGGHVTAFPTQNQGNFSMPPRPHGFHRGFSAHGMLPPPASPRAQPVARQWTGNLLESNSTDKFFAALAATTNLKVAPSLMQSMHAPKDTTSIQALASIDETRGVTAFQTTSGLNSIFSESRISKPIVKSSPLPAVQEYNGEDDDEDCLNFRAEASNEPLISISDDTDVQAQQQLTFLQKMLQYVIKPNWPDLLVNFSDPLQQIIKLCYDYALNPEKLLKIIQVNDGKSTVSHELQTLAPQASHPPQTQRTPQVDILSDENLENLFQHAKDSYTSKMNEAKAEDEVKAQIAAKELQEKEMLRQKEREERERQHTEAMLELKRKQEEEERERKEKVEHEKQERERLQKEKEEARIKKEEAERKRREEEERVKKEKEEADRLRKKKEEEERMKKAQEEARLERELEDKEKELARQKAEQQRVKQIAEEREKERLMRESFAQTQRELQHKVGLEKANNARMKGDMDQGQNMSRSRLGSAALSVSIHSGQQNGFCIPESKEQAHTKDESMKHEDPDVATQNRVDAIRLSKQKPFSLPISIDLRAVVPHCDKMPLTINCLDDPTNVILCQIRRTVTSREYDKVTTDHRFRDWLAKVDRVFHKKMVKEWGSDKYVADF